MSDNVTKFVRKLTPKQREVIEELLLRVKSGDLAGLDVKKMKGEGGLYRVRKGKVRLVFEKDSRVVKVDYRGNIYK